MESIRLFFFRELVIESVEQCMERVLAAFWTQRDIFRLQPLIFRGGNSVQNKEIKHIHFLQLRQKQKEKKERQREENRKKDTWHWHLSNRKGNGYLF